MKIVKEHINEKFEETSDPVRDMHVGGIDLSGAWNETIGDGVQRWYKFLHDLELIGKKVSFTDANTGKEITMVVDSIKRGRMPNEIFFYSNKKIQHRLSIKNKLYIHDV